MGQEVLPAAGTTVTSTSLLQGLEDPANEEAWRQYVERYRPLILNHARRFGVSSQDAEDVAQAVLMAFTTSYREGKYDRHKGRLRSWLFGIAQRQVQNHLRKQRDSRRPDGESELSQLAADDDELARAWDEEWRDAVLRQCFRELQPFFEARTLRAFERVALRGEPVDRVASELGLSAESVYCGKRRILRRMRDLLPLMEEVF